MIPYVRGVEPSANRILRVVNGNMRHFQTVGQASIELYILPILPCGSQQLGKLHAFQSRWGELPMPTFTLP